MAQKKEERIAYSVCVFFRINRNASAGAVNEKGIIFLLNKVAEDLGITIDGIQVKFPDAFGKRYEKDKEYPITIQKAHLYFHTHI